MEDVDKALAIYRMECYSSACMCLCVCMSARPCTYNLALSIEHPGNSNRKTPLPLSPLLLPSSPSTKCPGNCTPPLGPLSLPIYLTLCQIKFCFRLHSWNVTYLTAHGAQLQHFFLVVSIVSTTFIVAKILLNYSKVVPAPTDPGLNVTPGHELLDLT